MKIKLFTRAVAVVSASALFFSSSFAGVMTLSESLRQFVRNMAPGQYTERPHAPYLGKSPGKARAGSLKAMKHVYHSAPVWKEKSNFLIMGQYSVGEEEGNEQLWGRQISEFEFELCCIPFFLYGYALGDSVLTDPQYTLIKLVRSSNRFGFRILFSDDAKVDEVLREIQNKGHLMESYSSNFIAVDAETEAKANTLSSYLSMLESQSVLKYDTAR